MSDLFDAWTGLGGTLSDLAVATNRDQRLEVFGVSGGIVQHTWQASPGGAFGPWFPFPDTNPLIDRVTAARNADGTLEVFAATRPFSQDPGMNVLHVRQGGGPIGWGDWAWLGEAWKGGVPTLRDVVVGTNADGRLEVFALSAGDGTCYHIYQTAPGSWDKATWAPLGGGPVNGALAVALDGSGRLQLFALDVNGLLTHSLQGNPWSEWGSLGFGPFSAFQVGTDPDGVLVAFAVDAGGALWYLRQSRPGTSWNGAQAGTIGAGLYADLTVGRDASMSLVVLAPRADDGVVTFALQSEGWSRWRSLEGGAVAGRRFSHPRAASGPGRLSLFALDQDGAPWWVAESPDRVVDQIRRIVRAVAPVVYLHPDEVYKPSSVEFFLRHVQFVNRDGTTSGPPMTAANLPLGPELPDTHLSIPPQNDWIKTGDLAGAKAYVHVLALPDGRGFDLQYFFFYPYNGNASLGIKLPLLAPLPLPLPFGAHQGDWESLVVRVDRQGTVLGVYCNQHSGGAWYLPGEYQVVGQQPVVYSALSGHPTFPTEGDFPTEGWVIPIPPYEFFLDNQTGKGDRWDCGAQHEIVAITGVPGVTFPEPWWLDFRGRYGGVGKATPQEVEATRVAILKWLLTLHVPSSVASALAEKVAGPLVNWYYGADAEEGPTAPKGKSWWNEVTPGGP